MNYLIFGISTFFIAFATGCKEKRIERKLLVEIVFNNQTQHDLSYEYITMDSLDTIKLIDVSPLSTSSIEIDTKGQVGNIDVFKGALDTFQGHGFPILLRFNAVKCLVFFEGDGSTTSNVHEYSIEEVTKTHYELIFVISDDHYNQAVTCGD